MFVVFCNLILARLLQRKRLIELKRLGVSIDPNLFYALFLGSTRLLRLADQGHLCSPNEDYKTVPAILIVQLYAPQTKILEARTNLRLCF